jgi:hypothetical protein
MIIVQRFSIYTFFVHNILFLCRLAMLKYPETAHKHSKMKILSHKPEWHEYTYSGKQETYYSNDFAGLV